MTTSVYESPSCVGGYRTVGVLRVHGSDAASFLNGMLTQKITGRESDSVFASARADAKGGVVGLFDVWAADSDTFYVLCEGSTASHWAETLDRFVFLEDVEMTDLDDWAVYTLQGAGVVDVLNQSEIVSPAEGRVVHHQSVHLLGRARCAAGGVDVLGARTHLEVLKSELKGITDDPETLERMRISAGHVRWPLDMAGRTLPHELGLRLTHLHFQKGCYVGQEIIHRLEVRGGIRRQVVVVETSAPVKAGEDLLGAEKTEGKMLGQVPRDQDGYLGLAQVRVEAAQVGALWMSKDGAEVRVVSCPHERL